MDNNFVHIRGTVKEVTQKGFIVDCKRFSGAIDTVFVRCYTSVIYDIDIGQKIEANGIIKTLNRKDTGEKKTYIEAKSLLCGCDFSALDDEQSVTLVGTICKKGYKTITKNGISLSGFALAVNETEQKSYYPQCICWGVDALLAENLPVGTRVKVVGRLQSREYKKNGRTRQTHEVSCSRISVVS